MKNIISQRWDTEYENGRYQNESPIKFVDKILETLDNHKVGDGKGIYLGCGNGRNYTKLVKQGLDICGVDISPVAIEQLSCKVSGDVYCCDVLDYTAAEPFDYGISIQIFQHGTQKEIVKYFQKASELLKPGGLLFLRVNSITTDVNLPHVVMEKTELGGITVKYTHGPKSDLDIHFYSREELDQLCVDFDYIITPYEDITSREYSGVWSQWEMILQKRSTRD